MIGRARGSSGSRIPGVLAGAGLIALTLMTAAGCKGPAGDNGDNGRGTVRTAPPETRPLPSIESAQKADKDLLGEIELAKAGDPSFESVASYLPALRKPREVVGVKYHLHDIGVGPDATLELSDDASEAPSPIAYFEVGRPPVRFGAAPAGCRKSLVDGAPVVAAVFDQSGIRFRQTVFGYSEGLSPEAPLWAWIELEAQSQGTDSPRTVSVSLFAGPKSAPKALKVWELRPTSAAPAKIYVRVPFDDPGAGWAEADEAGFDAKKNEVLAFWKDDLGRGARLQTPEPRVNAARDAWLAYASLDVDKRDGVLEPHDGAGFYEQVYGYSAALYPHALDLWGRPDEARAILDSLLTFQAPDGLFTSHFGTPDPGTLLFTMSEHYALTADAAWLRRVAPNMIRAADWIIRKRTESTTPPGVPRPATYGLIKFSPYCDYSEPAYDYFGDTYCASGLERTAKALAAAGLASESERIGREAAAYRRDILASMDAAAFDHDGMKVLPLEPETHRILNDSKGRASDYYDLIASCMLESELLPAADPRAAWVMRFLEAKGGLRLGMCEFGGGIDHAYTYGYWLASLKVDRVEPVILGFYGSLAYGMSRDTYSGVEVTRLFTGDNEPTLPHLYSCTQQLRLLRMMLVREDGDALWIGQAVPRHWMAEGNAIEMKDAPTAFGPVSFAIRPHPRDGRIEVEVDAPSRRTPEVIHLRLRDATGRKIAAVKVNGRPTKTFSAETVELREPAGRLRIDVLYDEKPAK
jgi:hypothetical protein